MKTLDVQYSVYP